MSGSEPTEGHSGPVQPRLCAPPRWFVGDWVSAEKMSSNSLVVLRNRKFSVPLLTGFHFDRDSFNQHIYFSRSRLPLNIHISSLTTTTFLLHRAPILHRCSRDFAPIPLRAASLSSSSSHDDNGGGDGDGDDDADEAEAAREAVREYLHELGLSGHESLEISLNSPNYLASLIDGVRDLDDLSLWNSLNSAPAPSPPLSFKKKVYLMAIRKGDKGMLPFLESLGLTLSTAIHLARYYSSSNTLPSLMLKVKYLKEIFFSEGDEEGVIGKNARRMMMHLSVSIDEDVQQTLSFFEKIQARRGGLDLLGSTDTTLRPLIESFPRLLLLSIETHMKPIMKFLEDIGVRKECKRNILLLFPPILFYDVGEIRARLCAFEKVGAANKDFGQMLVKYPWILSKSILDNCKVIMDFFDKEQVPRESVAYAIRNWPFFLGCSVKKLKFMVEQFDAFGIKNEKLGQVIARSPQLLWQRPQEFIEVVYLLGDLGLEKETIGRILGRCPEIFALSTQKTINKKLKFLCHIGVSRNHLHRVIRKYPELFVCDIDRALLPRIKYLMKIGLSKREVAFMVRKFSPLLGYSIDNVLRPKLEFLVNTMKKPPSDVVEYPRYFSYSLEKKIKPRYLVLKGRNINCSLKEMLGKNDEEFAADFIGTM